MLLDCYSADAGIKVCENGTKGFMGRRESLKVQRWEDGQTRLENGGVSGQKRVYYGDAGESRQDPKIQDRIEDKPDDLDPDNAADWMHRVFRFLQGIPDERGDTGGVLDAPVPFSVRSGWVCYDDKNVPSQLLSVSKLLYEEELRAVSFFAFKFDTCVGVFAFKI